MFAKWILLVGIVSAVSSSSIACIGIDDSSIGEEPPPEAAQAIPPQTPAPRPTTVEVGNPPVFHPKCGGVIAIPCPDGLVCVDDPTDNCNPAKGDSDCGGICVSPGAPPPTLRRGRETR